MPDPERPPAPKCPPLPTRGNMASCFPDRPVPDDGGWMASIGSALATLATLGLWREDDGADQPGTDGPCGARTVEPAVRSGPMQCTSDPVREQEDER